MIVLYYKKWLRNRIVPPQIIKVEKVEKDSRVGYLSIKNRVRFGENQVGICKKKKEKQSHKLGQKMIVSPPTPKVNHTLLILLLFFLWSSLPFPPSRISQHSLLLFRFIKPTPPYFYKPFSANLAREFYLYLK